MFMTASEKMRHVFVGHTVECRYNAIQYNMILHTSFTRIEAGYQSDAEPTKDNPYLALTVELWGVFRGYFLEKIDGVTTAQHRFLSDAPHMYL